MSQICLNNVDFKYVLVFTKLEQRSRPNPCPVSSYPPTPQVPLPLPFKTLEPSTRVRVLEGWGQGQPFLTPGLPRSTLVMSLKLADCAIKEAEQIHGTHG